MSTKKCFVVLAVVVCLAATLWGQEPNDVVELKTTIAKLEKQIEEQEKKIKRLREELRAGKEELQAEQEENKRLTKICREAGINVEKTESPMQADYEVCTTPIEQNVLSDSMKTLGFTKLEVGALGWIDYIRIEHIIDANNAIVTIQLERMLENKHLTYEQVYEQTQAHVFDRTVWLKGVQTKGRADDSSLKINHYFAVTGTTAGMDYYTTLYVIEPVILSPERLKQETLRYKDLTKPQSQTGSQKPPKPPKPKR
jgi:outer membrane murein-binding lipoprotein Lpp